MRFSPSLRVGVSFLLLALAVVFLWLLGLFPFQPPPAGPGSRLGLDKGNAPAPILPGSGKKKGRAEEAGPGAGPARPGRKKVLPGEAPLSQGEGSGLLVVRVWEKGKKGLTHPGSSKVHLETRVLNQFSWGPFLLGKLGGAPKGEEKRAWVFPVGEKGVLSIRLWGEGGILSQGDATFRLWAESRRGNLVSDPKEVRADPRTGIWLLEGGWKVRPHKGIDLVLHPRRDLEFIVKDGEGRGVSGVLVGLYSTNREIARYQSLWFRSRSGPGGKGAFQDPWAGMRSPFGGAIDFKKFYLGFLFPMPDPSRRFFPIRKDNMEGSPVEMRLPPTGRIEVHVSMPGKRKQDISGLAALHDPSMQWRDCWARGPVGESRFWIRRNSVPLEHGRALFPRVGLGMDLDLMVLPEGRVNFTEKRIHGPSSPGETVRVDVLLSPDPVLALRLAGPAGEALSGRKVEVYIYIDSDPLPVFPGIGASSFHEIGRTGPAGDLRVPLPRGFYDGKGRVIFLVVRNAGGGQVLFRKIQALEGLRPAEWKMGLVRLASLPLIASGRVVVQGGGDVSGSAVVCKVFRIRRGKPVWWPIGWQRVGRDGRFSFRGFLEDREVEVLASLKKSGLWGKAEKVPLGARNVLLKLFRGGEIRGRLLVDEGKWLKQGFLNVYLYPRFPLGSLHWDPVKKVEESGRFSYEGCSPGRYDFLVTLGWWPGIPVYRLEGLNFLSGKKPFRGDLGVIDLRGRLEKVELEFFDQEGKPLDFYHPRRPVQVEGVPETVLRKAGNRISFLKRRGEILELRVSVKGFKKKKITLRGTGGKVVLERG